MTWTEFLKQHHGAPVPPFDQGLLHRWGGNTWGPTADDRKAAGKLHTQLESRITTQRLGYLDGVEAAALKSVFELFERTRQIVDAHPEGHHFETIAWHVLNTHVRPFTAKWHRQSQLDALAALDGTDEFRAELQDLQTLLRRFDELLLDLRDDTRPSLQPQPAGGRTPIEQEMDRAVPCGIPHGWLGRHGSLELNDAEFADIVARRKHYQLTNHNRTEAVGLAISGGGIRSATFSLGVLIALAGRGVLNQIDYLSTVSGGGYLGSFLSAFLNSPRDSGIGLRPSELPFRRTEGEAAALRHIRHHSRYMAVGSLSQKVQMLSGQLYGMVLNTLAVLWLVLLAVVLERAIRGWPVLDGRWGVLTVAAAVGLVLLGVVALVAIRFGKLLQKADLLVAWPAAILLALLVWQTLPAVRSGLPATATPNWQWLQGVNKDLVVMLIGAIPFVASALVVLLGRMWKRSGLVLAIVSAVAAPLFLFGVYTLAHAWAAPGINTIPFTERTVLTDDALWIVVLTGAVATIFLFNINFTGTHRHYRDRLARAYLLQARGERSDDFDSGVSVNLSQLASDRAPYHLVNCALNVPGSEDIAMQGRLTDFFLFSRRYCGSPLIGYEQTSRWEDANPGVNLATAMAISGAAAAPQMGLGTIPRLSFWLTLLNVRLGYWILKPSAPWLSRLAAPGLWHLLQEMLGTMNEKRARLFLSDGGHIENLGVYELLRRRCKYIIAIDGEQDAQMTFQALTTLQRMAYIDFGITIDIDLNDMRLTSQGLSRSHFRFCRIRYPKEGQRGTGEDIGYLLYVKLSLTGNEGEFIRRYRLDEPAFPHHSTADQMFSESQFEAYRSLGEHVGDKLFLRAIVDDLEKSDEVAVPQWFARLGTNLLEPLK